MDSLGRMSTPRRFNHVLYAGSILLALTCMVLAAPERAQSAQVVNLELVLLVDVSASVNDDEYRLQTRGLATAFRSASVLNAIRAMTPRGIAVCLVQWADHEHQYKSIDWVLLRNEDDAYRLAGDLSSMQRRIRSGHTALGNALLFALNELQTNQFEGLRRVIDLSGDGRKNDGMSLRAAREEVLGHRVTINGLAILNELPLLGKYFKRQLIGGEASFVLTAKDYSDFASAMSEKLEREIRSAPLTKNRTLDQSTVRVTTVTRPQMGWPPAGTNAPAADSLP